MDLATLIGMIGGIGIVIFAMTLGGSLSMFADVPSVLIVLVGSILVCMMKFNIGQFLGAGKTAVKAFMFKLDSPEDMITLVVELADSARKGGLLSLEGKEISNSFLEKGIGLLIDGHDADVVKTVLMKDKNMAVARHKTGASVWMSLGDLGPAMGMIGTLIGLVAMLSNMDDPKAIGPAMAVALLTTLYGAMLANLFCLPVAFKLQVRCVEEKLNQSLVLDGILGIADGQNPRVIEGVLKGYIAEGKRGSSGDEVTE